MQPTRAFGDMVGDLVGDTPEARQEAVGLVATGLMVVGLVGVGSYLWFYSCYSRRQAQPKRAQQLRRRPSDSLGTAKLK